MIKGIETFDTVINETTYIISVQQALTGFFAYGQRPNESPEIKTYYEFPEIGPGFSKTSSDEAILKLVKMIEYGK